MKAYWVYVHDTEGDLVEDLGSFDHFTAAHAKATQWLRFQAKVEDHFTVRIVDNVNLDGTTCWAAGDVNFRPAADGELVAVI